MFKVTNKETRTTLSSVSIVNFEPVNAGQEKDSSSMDWINIFKSNFKKVYLRTEYTKIIIDKNLLNLTSSFHDIIWHPLTRARLYQ